MSRLNREELTRQLEADKENWIRFKTFAMKRDHLDDDGYPTNAALALIKAWHWTDCTGLFEFIKEIWHLRTWGWTEGDAKDLEKSNDDYSEAGGKLYFVSTGGWSGNESIIRALQSNTMAWTLTWVQSRRGGHYIFKQHEFKDDK